MLFSRIFAISIFTIFGLQSTIAAASEPARVVGLDIGTTTIEQARNHLRDNRGKLQIDDISAITGGPVLVVHGDLGLEGLRETVLLFNPDGKLVAALLTLPKQRYSAVLQALKTKYRLKNTVEPFVGNRSATLVAQDAEILAEAPHMSFEMTVTYGTSWFWQQWAEYQRRKQADHRQRTAERL